MEMSFRVSERDEREFGNGFLVLYVRRVFFFFFLMMLMFSELMI